MNPSTELFDLIKSMDKSEKRYFKLSFSGRKNSNFLKLFDEIESQDSYNEKVIKEKFSNEKFVNQLTFTKNYLYNSILNSLISYNRVNSSETRLTEMVIKLRILFDKALYPQYFKMLVKYKQKAIEYEKFYIHLEILRLQRLISETRKFRIIDQEQLYIEEKVILKKIANLGEYSKLFYNSKRLRRKAGISGKIESIKEADKILKHKLLSNEKYALSTQAREYFHHIRYVLYSIKGDEQNRYESCRERLECIESNPKPFLDDIVNVRKETLFALAELTIEMNNTNEFKNHLQKFLISNNSNEVIERKIISDYIDLRHIMQNNFLKNGENVIERVEQKLVKHKGKLDKDMELESMFMIAKYYFYKSNFDIALTKNNDVLSHPVIKYRHDIYINSKLLNIALHYELGNISLAEYLIDSMKKMLRHDIEQYNDELKTLSLVNKLVLTHGHNVSDKQNDIKTELEELQQSALNKNVGYYFNIIKWVESKLEILQTAKPERPYKQGVLTKKATG